MPTMYIHLYKGNDGGPGHANVSVVHPDGQQEVFGLNKNGLSFLPGSASLGDEKQYYYDGQATSRIDSRPIELDNDQYSRVNTLHGWIQGRPMVYNPFNAGENPNFGLNCTGAAKMFVNHGLGDGQDHNILKFFDKEKYKDMMDIAPGAMTEAYLAGNLPGELHRPFWEAAASKAQSMAKSTMDGIGKSALDSELDSLKPYDPPPSDDSLPEKQSNAFTFSYKGSNGLQFPVATRWGEVSREDYPGNPYEWNKLFGRTDNEGVRLRNAVASVELPRYTDSFVDWSERSRQGPLFVDRPGYFEEEAA
jgi:hypothetical protein